MLLQGVNGEVPSPNACAACGRDRQYHYNSGHPVIGMHTWIEPTDAVRKFRIKARGEYSLYDALDRLVRLTDSITPLSFIMDHRDDVSMFACMYANSLHTMILDDSTLDMSSIKGDHILRNGTIWDKRRKHDETLYDYACHLDLNADSLAQRCGVDLRAVKNVISEKRNPITAEDATNYDYATLNDPRNAVLSNDEHMVYILLCVCEDILNRVGPEFTEKVDNSNEWSTAVYKP